MGTLNLTHPLYHRVHVVILYKLVLFVIKFLNICVKHIKQRLLARLDALGPVVVTWSVC